MGIEFEDVIPLRGRIGGVISIGRALDEEYVEYYNIHWACNWTSVRRIVSLPKPTCGDCYVTYDLENSTEIGAGITTPIGATQLMVTTSNATFALELGPATSIYDDWSP